MKGARWYGPLVNERISGLQLVGQASLRPFFDGINFEEDLGKLFMAFDRHQQHLECSVREESSITSTLTASNSITEIPPDLSMLEQNFPSTDLVAATLRFLRLIVYQDNQQEDKYQSLSRFKEITFPLTLKLLTNNNLKIEDQCLLHSLTDWILACVINYSWTGRALLEEDNCFCLSMLVTTYHRLSVPPGQLLELLTVLLTQVMVFFSIISFTLRKSETSENVKMNLQFPSNPSTKLPKEFHSFFRDFIFSGIPTPGTNFLLFTLAGHKNQFSRQ